MARTEKEKMLAGEPYLATDPELATARAQAKRLLRAYNQTFDEDPAERARVLEQLLGGIGAGSWIEPPFFCDYGAQVRLGARVYINTGCVILDCNPVTIGDDVQIGPGVHLYAATHPLDAATRSLGPELGMPVWIGNQVWIGGGAIVCPGVRIGSGSTIGAGSVVTRDVPENVLAAGNPCRVIRSLR